MQSKAKRFADILTGPFKNNFSPSNESVSIADMSNGSTPTEENGNKNIAVEQLANGFLNLYENDVIRVKRNLQEILYDFGVIAM